MYDILQNVKMYTDQEEVQMDEKRILLADFTEAYLQQHPTADKEAIYERASQLQNIYYGTNFSKSSQSVMGTWEEQSKTISVTPNPYEDEFLCHEFCHCITQKSTDVGVKLQAGVKINEALTQYNTFKAYSEINPDARPELLKINVDNVNYMIPAYGKGYNGMNHIGCLIQELYHDEVDLSMINGKMVFSDGINSSTLLDSVSKLDDKIPTSTDIKNVYLENIIDCDKQVYLMAFSTAYEKDIPFSKFLEDEKTISKNIVKIRAQTENGLPYLINPLKEEMACGDIIMWAKDKGMDISQLQSQLDPDTRSEKCQDFVNCCEILRYQNWDLGDIEKLKYQKQEVESGTIYTINGGFNMKCSILIGDDNRLTSVEPQKTSMFGWEHIAFSEKDLQASQEKTFDEMLKTNPSTALFKAYVAEAPDEASIYGRLSGHKTSFAENPKPLSYEDAKLVITEGKYFEFSDSINKNLLLFNKDPLIRELIEQPQYYTESINLIADGFFMTKGAEIPGNFTQEYLDKNPRFLLDLYENDDRIVAKLIEDGMDINTGINNNTVAGLFYRDGGLVHFDAFDDLQSIESYSWLMEHGQNINAIIVNNDKEQLTFFDAVCINGYERDLTQMFSHPDYNPNALTAEGKLQGELLLRNFLKNKDNPDIVLTSESLALKNMDKYTSLPEFDINAKNEQGHTLFQEVLIKSCEDNINVDAVNKFLTLLEDKGADIHSSFDGEVTTANLFAASGHIEIVSNAIEHGVSFDEIFSSSLPEGWAAKFDDEKLESLKNLIHENEDKLEKEETAEDKIKVSKMDDDMSI